MRNSKLFGFLAIMLVVAAVIIFLRSLENKHAISSSMFDETMEKVYYAVYDSYELRSGDTKDTFSKITDYDSYIKPAIKREAIFANRTHVVFMVYNSDEDAVLVSKRYINDQTLKVYKDDFYGNDYLEDSKSTVTRKGENYNRFYTKNLNKDYILISQIDNTLLVAYVDKLDIVDFNTTMLKLGY